MLDFELKRLQDRRRFNRIVATSAWSALLWRAHELLFIAAGVVGDRAGRLDLQLSNLARGIRGELAASGRCNYLAMVGDGWQPHKGWTPDDPTPPSAPASTKTPTSPVRPTSTLALVAMPAPLRDAIAARARERQPQASPGADVVPIRIARRRAS